MEGLLEHSDWARRLAMQLVGDAQGADDLVQEAWLTAIKNPPRHTENLRGWIGSVVRRLAASEWRTKRTRDEREQRGARPEALPPTDQLVHEAQLSKELVEAVVAMAEPFKSVLLMRYFRDHKPAQIARELGRPVATVKTQIQRGLEQLREELDGRYGDRRSWCLALMPLVRRTADAGGVGLGAGAWVAAAGVLAIGLWSFGGHEAAAPQDSLVALEPSAPAQTLAVDVPLQAKASEREPQGLAGSSPSVEQDAQVPVLANEVQARPGFLLEGVLLRTDLQPVAGLRLRWTDSGALRWKSASMDVIVGASTWVPVSAKQREQFQTDGQALNAFVQQNFIRADLARALLLGEPAPTIETISDGGGRFHMQLPTRSYNIEILDLHSGVLGRTKTLDSRGQEQLTWFVAQRRTLAGVVVDLQGEAVEGATVIAGGVFPEALRGKLAMGSGLSSKEVKVQTDEKGRFEIKGETIGAKPMVHAELGEARSDTVAVQMPDDPAQEPASVLLRLIPSVTEAPSFVLEGRVLLEDGSVAPRATVVFGTEITSTDLEGNYRLPVGDGDWDLFAARSGTGIAILREPTADRDARGDPLRLADLVLPRASHAIEGRVVDALGNGVANVTVDIYTGITLDRRRRLEDLAAGRSRGHVKTDATGAFRLDGLADRDYQLSLQRETSGTVSDSIRAGSNGVTLVFP